MRDKNRYAERIVNLIYPRHCPVCDDIVPVGEGLVCLRCREKIRYVDEPRCRRCGKHLTDENSIFCHDCANKNHSYEYGYAVYEYHSMNKSIYRFKYKGRCEYAKFYAQDVCRILDEEIRKMDADALIPVPLHKSKLTLRGYNQAELVADEISHITGIPVAKNLVKRVRKTIPQKELDDRERQNNLKKAFNITSDVVKLNKTIVIDDIYTTGSTIDAVAKELKQHGVGKVYFITLCIGEGL